METFENLPSEATDNLITGAEDLFSSDYSTLTNIDSNQAQSLNTPNISLESLTTTTTFEDNVLSLGQSNFIPSLNSVDPNTRELAPQWYLLNTGQTGGTPGADVNTLPVWNKYNITGQGVVVGVIDDGLQSDHPDLTNQYRGDLSRNFSNNSNDPVTLSTNSYTNNFSSLMEDESNTTITLDLPVNLTGLVNDVDIDLNTQGLFLEDLTFILSSPESLDSPLSRRGNRASRRWPGVEDFSSKVDVELTLEDDGSLTGELTSFNRKFAGGVWQLEISVDNSDYSGEQFRQLVETIENSWSLDLSISTSNPHGTAVAGIIAATGNNDEGIIGAAYEVGIAGLRLIGDTDPINETDGQTIANALSHQLQEIDIYNSSWVPEYLLSQSLALEAIETGVTTGRGGLGSIYVFAAGNGGYEGLGDNINYNAFAQSRHTIAVGSIDHNNQHSPYSTGGSSLFVSTYSDNGIDDFSFVGIETTDLEQEGYHLTDAYYSDFGGTSASAALASGIIALMLEANPNLTHRDVQHILVETAVKVDLEHPEWIANGAGYWFNPVYGFGGIDATAAVEMALEWAEQNITVGTEANLDPIPEYTSGELNLAIPDDSEQGVVSSLEVEENITLEWVEVEVDIDHQYWGDLEVVLVHNYNGQTTSSVLATPHLLPGNSDSRNGYQDWKFTSVQHWGESSQGEWTVEVRDEFGDIDTTEGILNSWHLNFYGTKPTVTLEATDPNASENGNSGEFTLTRTGNTQEDFVVNYTISGSADSSDYGDNLSQSAIIPAGQASVTIPVSPIEDTVLEEDETVILSLTENPDYKLNSANTGVVIITDYDAQNIAPTATNLTTSQIYTEDTPLDLVNIFVIDDNPGQTITVNLILSDPTAGVITTGTVLGTTATYNPDTGVWSSTGLASEINSLLRGIEFIPTANFNGDVTISTEVTDNIAAPITGAISLTGTPINDAPTLSNIGTILGASDNQPFTISYADLLNAANVTDVDGDEISFRIEEVISGNLTKNGEAITPGLTTIGNADELVWESNLVGNAIPVFRVLAFDGSNYSSQPILVTVTVNGEVDLLGESFEVQPEQLEAGENLEVEFQIQNLGTSNSSEFDVDFYLSSDSIISTRDHFLGSYSIESLAGNTSSNLLTEILSLPELGHPFWDFAGDGIYHVGMIVDASNKIAEINEENENILSNNLNVGEGIDSDTIDINGSQEIDLSGQLFNVIQEPLQAGESFDVQFQIQNLGTSNSSEFDVQFYLSNDNEIGSIDDWLLGDYTINNLLGNRNSGSLTTNFTLPNKGDLFWNIVNDGTYHIGMVIDPNNTVGEINEANNHSTFTGVDYQEIDIINTQFESVTVTIHRVRQIDDLDRDFTFFEREADFYTRVQIGEIPQTSGIASDQDDTSPNWVISAAANNSLVPITIELFDADNENKDDLVDINPNPGNINLYLNYNLLTGEITGDVSGVRGEQINARGEGDPSRAEIWFTIDHT